MADCCCPRSTPKPISWTLLARLLHREIDGFGGESRERRRKVNTREGAPSECYCTERENRRVVGVRVERGEERSTREKEHLLSGSAQRERIEGLWG
jgi:hypothetical protein